MDCLEWSEGVCTEEVRYSQIIEAKLTRLFSRACLEIGKILNVMGLRDETSEEYQAAMAMDPYNMEGSKQLALLYAKVLGRLPYLRIVWSVLQMDNEFELACLAQQLKELNNDSSEMWIVYAHIAK